MKYFFFKCFNTIFLLFLIYFKSSNTLSVIQKNNSLVLNKDDNKIKMQTEQLLNENDKNRENNCLIFENEKDKHQILDQTIEQSKNDKKYPDRFYFLFFLNRNDNFNEIKVFSNEINNFFGDLIQITFYCKNKQINRQVNINASKDDKFDLGIQYVIQHGEVLEKKKIEYLSEQYIDYLLKRFNLTNYLNNKVHEIKNKNNLVVNQIQLYIDNSKAKRTSFLEFDSKIEHHDEIKKNQYALNFIQTNLHSSSIKHINKNDFLILADETTDRFMRFVWAMLIVLISSIGCFLLVKSSVDWATTSQTELNRMKTNQLEELTRQVKNKYSYIVNTEA